MTAPPETLTPRVVFEDPDLPHQIVITVRTSDNGRIAVSCNCLRREARKPIEARSRWEPGEAIAVWRKHMAEIGEPAE